MIEPIRYDLPCYEFIWLLSKNCPEAIFTYLELYKLKEKNNQVFLSKNDIRANFPVSWAKLLTGLRLLANEGVLEWKLGKNLDTLYITLSAQEELC
jgi:hypothetical protein